MEKDLVFERWDKLGLLEGLNDEAKKIVAHAFEHLAYEIMDNEVKKDLETISFPILRRILQTNDNYNKFTTITVTELVSDMLPNLISACDDKYEESKEECKKLNIDFEAEFCERFAEKYIKDNF